MLFQELINFPTLNLENYTRFGTLTKKPRNAGTMTESAYWGMVRSGLRRTFRYWKPLMKAKEEAKRKYTGKNKRQKWEYQCNKCKKWYKGTEVQVDHITPVGSLKSGKDLKGFLERLTAEKGYQVLCLWCHKEKTRKERVSK